MPGQTSESLHCIETNKFQPTKTARRSECRLVAKHDKATWGVGLSSQVRRASGKKVVLALPGWSGLLVQIRIFVLEVTDLALCLFLGDPVALLHPARKLVPVALKFLQVIVSELTPLFLNLALKLHPLTGGFILIHVALLKGMDKTYAGLLEQSLRAC
jgi:hypothetical protein